MDVIRILEQEMSLQELMDKLKISDRKYFRTSYIQPAMEQGFVAMEFPEAPNHPKQRYYLTTKGIELKNRLLSTGGKKSV